MRKRTERHRALRLPYRNGVEERVPVYQYRDRNKQAITLTTAGVPAASVNNVAEMVADPQVQARGMFVELEHPTYGPVTITGTPLKLSETPGRVEHLAPLPGEHNAAIFTGLLGHTRDELEQWREAGVI